MKAKGCATIRHGPWFSGPRYDPRVVRASLLCRWVLVGTVGVLTVFGCEGSDDEADLDVVLASTPGALGGTTTSAAYLSLKSIEIVPCVDARAPLFHGLFRVRSAWAHEISTPTRLGVPVLDDLGRAATATLGTLAPPPGSYCSVRLKVGPADADAVGMPPDRAALGRSLWVTGTTPDGASFTLTTTETRTLDLPVARFQTGERRLTLRLSRVPGDVLDGVDLSPSAIDEASRTVLERLASTMRAEVQ